MTWTDREWDAFAGLLERGWGWPAEFTVEDGDAYRVLLAGIPPARAVEALQVLVLRGGKFRPSAGEIAGQANKDAGKPTFEEAYRLIYGRRGVLSAQPRQTTWSSPRERQAQCDQAALERADDLHPYISAFVRTLTPGYLATITVDDEEYGPLRRRELRESWDRFVTAADERVRTGRVLEQMGRRSQIGPRRLDPLGVLGITPPALELVEGADDAR